MTWRGFSALITVGALLVGLIITVNLITKGTPTP